MNAVDYVVVKAASIEILRLLVVKRLEYGFVPIGGIVIDTNNSSDPYYQAMVCYAA